MNPKIVFSDIDGTIIDKNRVLSNNTISAIKRIKDEIPVILISSRMPSAMTHLQKSASIEQYPLVSFNGGLILVNGQVVANNPIKFEIVEEIVKFNATGKVHISLYNIDDWYVPRNDYWTKREINNTKIIPKILSNEKVIELWRPAKKGSHKIMCMGDPKAIDEIYDFMEQNFGDYLHLYRSKNTYIEIAAKHISKKTAVEYILENIYPEININDAAAFGDNYNDAEMLGAVGIGVAVANAKPEILEIAKYTTAAGTDDGVAQFLNKHVQLTLT